MSWLRRTSLLKSVHKYVTTRQLIPALQCTVRMYSDGDGKDDDIFDEEPQNVPIPPYQHRENEPLEIKKARLIYQSRKRGMLENGILLSTFAGKYLSTLTEEQLEVYDTLINEPTNDWDIFDWIVKRKPVPEEYDSDVMKLIQEHAQNKEMEERFVQPPLYES